MRAALVLLGVLLGMGGVLLYQWMKPSSDDPYFFLSPRITESHSVNIPLELYKKGSAIDVVFWITPLPSSKFLYLFPVSPPASHIILNVVESKKTNINFFPSEIFSDKGPIKNIGNAPVLNLEIYKINSNQKESLIIKKTQTIDKVTPAKTLNLISLNHNLFKYGQYRLKVEVLGDWPELKIDGLDYFITIETYSVK